MDNRNLIQLTNRDIQILNDLSMFPLLPAHILSKYYFKHYKTGMKRLKSLHDSTYLQEQFIGKYKYYMLNPKIKTLIKKPIRQLDNIFYYYQYTSEYEIYKTLIQYGDVEMFPEYPINTFAYLYTYNKHIAYLVQLDLCGDIFNNIKILKQYEEIYKSGDYKKYYPKHPRILFITTSDKIQSFKEQIKDLIISQVTYIGKLDEMRLFNKAIWYKSNQMDKIMIEI